MHALGLCHSQGTPSLENLYHLQANLPKICPEERHYFTRLDSKQISSVLWRETLTSKAVNNASLSSKGAGREQAGRGALSQSSKTVCYTNILEEMGNKGQSAFLLKKCTNMGKIHGKLFFKDC